jgi:hypothetical protein
VEAGLAVALAQQRPVVEQAAQAMAAPTLVAPAGVAEPVAAVREQVEEVALPEQAVAVPERVAAVLGTAALLQVTAVRAARAVAVVARLP